MDFIYFAVKSAPIFNDKLKACQTYFINDGGFMTAFWWALGIAAVFAVVYYVIARMSFKWPSLLTWFISMLLCGCASFFLTGMQTGIHDKGGAFPHVVEKQYKVRAAGLTDTQKAPLDKAKQELNRQFKKTYFGSSPVNRLCWTNFVLSMIFFYVFSICINGLSLHGDNTPHRGLLTKRN